MLFWKLCCCSCLIAQSCLTLCNAWAVAHQTPLSKEFSRQEYRNGMPFPSPGNIRHPKTKSQSPTLEGGSFTTEPPAKLWKICFKLNDNPSKWVLGWRRNKAGNKKLSEILQIKKIDLSLVRRNTLIQKVTPVCPFYCSHYLDRK